MIRHVVTGSRGSFALAFIVLSFTSSLPFLCGFLSPCPRTLVPLALDLWLYVHYVTYLYQKDDTEFNGLESYVFAQLQEQALDWIPNRTSLVIQEQRIKEKLVYQEDDGEEQGVLA